MNSTPPSPPSRKRQRSSSMLSDTSSTSVKRSLSDGPEDTYMAELAKDTVQLVPPAEKLARVDGLKNGTMNAGDTWYLIDRTWWKRWRKACTGLVDKDGGVTEEELGPVNNSALVDANGYLRTPLSDSVDYELVPEAAWNDLVSCCLFFKGTAPPRTPLPRQVILRGEQKEPTVELYPLRLIAMRMLQVPTTTTDPSPPKSLSISCASTAFTLNKSIVALMRPHSVPETTPFRVWKVNAPPSSGFDSDEFAVDDFGTYECENVDGGDKTLEQLGIMQGDAFVVEFKAPSWLVDAPPQPLEPAPPVPLFASGTGFFDRLGLTGNKSAKPPARSTNSGARPGLFSSTSTTKTLEPGTLGLGNMGNTCFMNSALQCLAHEPELAEYFLTNVYSTELNPDNPLGMGGAIAQAFGALLQKIWATSSPSTSYSPREFKTQLQRFAPQFSGYQQHDSQELVAFLLDGLHEDLNRVHKKPYVEKPDWEGGGDAELVQLARKSWEGYMLRNDSVIVDLFQGQYQSTLVCPECQKVSITFDPFMYLTLPLPVQKKWKHSIFYVPWDVSKPHVKVPVEIGRDASFKDLRQLLGRWMGAPPDNYIDTAPQLLTLEIFSHKFYKNLDDSLLCGEMAQNDMIVCYELPCHAQQSRTYKPAPDDPLIVPVYLADLRVPPSAQRSTMYSTSSSYTPSYQSSYQSITYFGYPTIAVLRREEAADVGRIYENVVERLERWACNARDLYSWEVPGGKGSSGSGSEAKEVEEGEIKPNGDVVEHLEVPEGEGDITDEKGMIVIVEDEDVPMEAVPIPGAATAATDAEPVRVGAKRDLFQLKVQPNMKDYGTANAFMHGNKAESFDARVEEAKAKAAGGEPVLLMREGDLLLCEFDENMKAFYFGDAHHSAPHHRFTIGGNAGVAEDAPRWDQWGTLVHPEFEESQREAEAKKNRGISLQDCLDEFTKEEQLGEDDLWYCPRCKKHQQATKKFDLWKAPDVLVVHLKRFSNSRTLRDKIDAFVDFPVEGLDLGEMIGERAAAKRLMKDGVEMEGLGLGNLDEPLIYDLFGVDEHMGGLGGGHYRAYALNHANGKWYHFDDSYVTPAKAQDSVNANAYLLFYRRRTTEPLGGKTQEKIEAARLKRQEVPSAPSSEDGVIALDPRDDDLDIPGLTSSFDPLRSAGGSSPSSMHDEPPDLEDALEALDPLTRSGQRFDFPDPSSNKASPASSTEAEGDPEDSDLWPNSFLTSPTRWSPSQNSPKTLALDVLRSPSDNSSPSDTNPFTDGHAETGSAHLKID
ncbi:hypothetical protein MVEN_00966500 [Mycena venus]|uniref:ubiquitinyl hydrolase 1 n=1 Tax=Mycena venus TaxID=2733690 RepID=A0A8H6YC04_9AGAR|nr:hypothetical protein MVEN_00966500 [Mycena venus]